MKLFSLFLLALSFELQAHYPPENFGHDSRGTNGNIFVDFQEAKSTITYDLSTYKVSAETVIHFYQSEQGRPIFDLIPTIQDLEIDGERSEAVTKSLPNQVSRARVISQTLSQGSHRMIIKNNIDKLVSFNSYNKTVRSAFWMSYLSDRRYLERYLPTNLEYDQYKNTFEIKITNTSKEHQLYANGFIKNIGFNHFEVSFPEYYTSSSVYFHLVEKGAYPETSFEFNSVDGRIIPVTIYTDSNIQAFKDDTLRILAELEGDYGPWPHDFLIVYGAGMGGMEYAGATRTSLRALGHELHHGYFARNMMPSRGNAGWVDEALASWRDNGYPRTSVGALKYSKMGGHSTYRRTTDTDAYSKGARVMAYFNYRLEEKGGLRPFLKEYFAKYKTQTFLTATFKDELETYLGQQLDNIFNPYVFGKAYKSNKNLKIKKDDRPNPMHPKLTDNQLMLML